MLANRYADSHLDDDDSIDMDLWFEMSDEEQEAELAAANRELAEVYQTLTPGQIYRTSRRSALCGCMTWRNMRRQGFVPEFAKEQLRKRQKRLVGLRSEYYSSTTIGSA